MKRLAVATLLTTATAAAAPPPPGPIAPPTSTTAIPPAAVPPASATAIPPASAVAGRTPTSVAERPLVPPSSVEPGPPKEEYVPNALLLVIAGGALGAGGLFAGGYLGYKIECASDCGGEFGGLGGLLLGAGIGLTAASTTGIMLTGIDGEHHSSAGLTWLGTAIGGAVGAVAASKVSNDLAGATFFLAGGSALGGTLMYYAARSKDRPAPAIRVVPFTDGGSVGVAIVGNAP